MKVFIAWSGELSKQAALALRDWLPVVVQEAEPFVSEEDVAKGKRWPKELGERLNEIGYGIICLTPSNLASPWIHFEAGALSKSLDESLVAPFLLKVKKSDVTWPLAQFQLTSYEQEDVYRMVRALNDAVTTPLDDSRLRRLFSRLWPDLKTQLDPLLDWKEPTPAVAHRSDQAILEELLELVRGQQRLLLEPSKDPLFLSHMIVRVSNDVMKLWIAANQELQDTYVPSETLSKEEVQDALRRLITIIEEVLNRNFRRRPRNFRIRESLEGQYGRQAIYDEE